MLSTHKAEVVSVKLENHPNADSLSIVRFDGFNVCVRTEDWIGIEKAVHIQPESLVDTTRPEFAFLADGKKDKMRVKPKRLRGIFSYGFLIPAPEDAKIGEDYSERLGIEHYEPPIKLTTQTDNVSAPPGIFTKYDIDNLRKYNRVFKEGELVFISEKINGMNMRVVYSSEKEQIYVGSRNLWKKEDERCAWWQAYKKYPQIKQFCKDHPNLVLYGEAYGNVGNMKYGKDNIDFAAFDIRRQDMSWINAEEFYSICIRYYIPYAPIIAFNIPFSFEEIEEFADGPSLIEGANHYREGVVIRPQKERHDDTINRVILKMVGETYLLKT